MKLELVTYPDPYDAENRVVLSTHEDGFEAYAAMAEAKANGHPYAQLWPAQGEGEDERHYGALTERITRRYVDDYRHLDRNDDVGVYKLLTHFSPGEEPEFDESWERILEVEVAYPRTITFKRFKQIIHDTFSKHGCACSHDCCGCVSTGVVAIWSHPHRKNHLFILTSSSRNY